METIAYIVLSTGNHHEITKETYEQINLASGDEFIQLLNGSSFKKSSVMEILGIEDYFEKYPEKKPAPKINYGGQDYSWDDLKQISGVGFEKMITRENRSRAIELMAKGLKKAKAKFNKETPVIDSLLKLARDREPLNKFNI